MLLKCIRVGPSLGLKVHDTVLRFQIPGLSMHVPDGVLTDMMGIERRCLGWGRGTCACSEVRMGVTFVLVPFRDLENCMPGPRPRSRGLISWGWSNKRVCICLNKVYQLHKKISFSCFFISQKTCNPSIYCSFLFRAAWCLLGYGHAWQGDRMTGTYQRHKTLPLFDKSPQWYYTGVYIADSSAGRAFVSGANRLLWIGALPAICFSLQRHRCAVLWRAWFSLFSNRCVTSQTTATVVYMTMCMCVT